MRLALKVLAVAALSLGLPTKASADEPAEWKTRLQSIIADPQDSNETSYSVDCYHQHEFGTEQGAECQKAAEALLNDTTEVAWAKLECDNIFREHRNKAGSIWLDCVETSNYSDRAMAECNAAQNERLQEPRLDRDQCFKDADKDWHITRHAAEAVATSLHRSQFFDGEQPWEYHAVRELEIARHRQAEARRQAETRNTRDAETERKAILDAFDAIQTEHEEQKQAQAAEQRILENLQAIQKQKDAVRQEFFDEVLAPCMADFLSTQSQDATTAAARRMLQPLAQSDPTALLELALSMAPETAASLETSINDLATMDHESRQQVYQALSQQMGC
ncbi:MAG: hypothetical protein F4X97_03430 [Boseongicola sp. SB0662_bin_57]|nr:hypothetical protein [Boseongicola sp. SB0662_bin_57]